MKKVYAFIFIAAIISGCTSTSKKQEQEKINPEMKQKVEEFASFTLTTDLDILSKKEKQMLPLLFKAADIMDKIYWIEAFGDNDVLFMNEIGSFTKKFIEINYGPWERLNNNQPFLEGYGPKPAGANFYPGDMTRKEFEAWNEETKTSQYTLIRRNKDKDLIS